MKKVCLISMMLLFVLDGWSQSTSASQQIDIKFKNGNSVQINANDVDYIDFTEDNPDTPVVPDNPDTPVVPDNPSTPVSPTAGYAVDLGLSVKWASCNVGASSCEEFGERYAWGELSPKSKYIKETYQYYDTDNSSYVDIGTYIGGTAHDVASVTWGGGWRMPTWNELDELRKNCTWTWTKVNGVNGYFVKGKNGNSIFFPVEDKSITLWACNLGVDERGGYYGAAELIRFSSSSYTWNNSGEDRWKGNYIRPVCRDEVSGSDKSSNYLTFVAEETGTFNFGRNIIYSLDNGLTWNRQTSKTKPTTVQAGKKIIWKAEFTPTSQGIGTFCSSGKFRVEGNVMSLLYGDFFEGKTDLTGMDGAFLKLFSGCTGLTNAEKLVLPATILSKDCYNSMFGGCTSLTKAPELPATTLASNCYYFMFGGCTSLTKAPELPATTLASACYGYMFEGCTSLTTAPVLPATTLASNCYDNMFNKCTSLTKAPELPATTLANGCYSHMFYKCTSLTKAPILPAKLLVNYCYDGMFNACSSLNYIKCLATEMSGTCCSYWVGGVSSSGTFVKNSSMSSWKNGYSGIPYGWTVQDDTTPGNNSGGSNDDTNPGNDSGGNNDNGKGDMSGNYLTFVALDNSTFKFTVTTGSASIHYSLDGGSTWNTLSSGENSPSVSAGQKIMWKGSRRPKQGAGIGTFSSTGRFNVEGNPMSLLYGETFQDKTKLNYNNAFSGLFKGNTNVISARDMVMPATTLSDYCYSSMFHGCTSLTKAPELPATALADGCYSYMFHGCTSLTKAPALPATTLAEFCYDTMFQSCTSLTTAPELPATSLAVCCYQHMFHDCPSLRTPPSLPATTLADWCCNGMFYGCTSLTTAPVLPATTLTECCYQQMFYACTSLTTAPVLPATTLADGCYEGMFTYCRSLNYIKCLATDINAKDCTIYWLSHVSSSGTFIKNSSMTGWTRGENGIPSGWTVKNE